MMIMLCATRGQESCSCDIEGTRATGHTAQQASELLNCWELPWACVMSAMQRQRQARETAARSSGQPYRPDVLHHIYHPPGSGRRRCNLPARTAQTMGGRQWARGANCSRCHVWPRDHPRVGARWQSAHVGERRVRWARASRGVGPDVGAHGGSRARVWASGLPGVATASMDIVGCRIKDEWTVRAPQKLWS